VEINEHFEATISTHGVVEVTIEVVPSAMPLLTDYIPDGATTTVAIRRLEKLGLARNVIRISPERQAERAR